MCRNITPWSWAILCWLTAASASAEEIVLHVASGGDDQARGAAAAPLATPHAALARLAELAQKSPAADVRIVLRAGTYQIEQPLEIGPAQVPPRGSLTLAAAEGAAVVISGGVTITGWQVRDDGVWQARLPTAAGNWRFRELLVGGQRRPRARHPNTDYVRIDAAFSDKRSGFMFRAGDLPESLTGGELVFLHDWSTSRIPIRSIEHDARRLTAAFPIGNRAPHYQIDHFEPHPRYFLEGHAALLSRSEEKLRLPDGGLWPGFPE
jgi:hypothetical protein